MSMNISGLHKQPDDEKKRCIAVYALWCTGAFDTLDIADLLGLEEADVYRTIHAFRNRQYLAGAV